MKHREETDHEIPDQVLKLLSDEEIARVRTATRGELRLADGDEYIDLAATHNGVRSVHRSLQVTVGHVLSRKAVSAATWAKISSQFGTRFATKPPK